MPSIVRQSSRGAPTAPSSRRRAAPSSPLRTFTLFLFLAVLFVWALHLYQTSIGLSWNARGGGETRLLEGIPLVTSSAATATANEQSTTAAAAGISLDAVLGNLLGVGIYEETEGPEFGGLRPFRERQEEAAEKAQRAAEAAKAAADPNDPDSLCPFRRSSLYRSVYVYPTPDFARLGKNLTGPSLAAIDPIYSPSGGRSNEGGRLAPYPWLEWDNRTRVDGGGWGHYLPTGEMAQYTTELIVRDIMTHPKSCLAAPNPDEAKLFYVPYLPSMEFHKGRTFASDYSTSPYAQAIYDAIEGKYDKWEELFGFTSKYWRKNNGADHILVYSEPLHGLSHPRNRRGNHHFIHTQRQLRPPIAVVVEMSTTFVKEYPKCAAKNILVPYPNPDGRWYNGKLDAEAADLVEGFLGADAVSVLKLVGERDAMLSAESEIAIRRRTVEGENISAEGMVQSGPRPVTYYYNAGNHGTCSKLRQAMQADYRCTTSYHALEPMGPKKGKSKLPSYALGMRMATFCPCPGGDSPSAKRNFDAVLAGCIPVVMSYDFVWPFSIEYDRSGGSSSVLNPDDFSVRLDNAMDFAERDYRDDCSAKQNDSSARRSSSLQRVFESLNATEVQRLRRGVKRAAELYSFYSSGPEVPDWDYRVGVPGMPNNPLREGVLPDGGAAHALLEALAARVGGERWAACEEEVKKSHGPEPRSFKC